MSAMLASKEYLTASATESIRLMLVSVPRAQALAMSEQAGVSEREARAWVPEEPAALEQAASRAFVSTESRVSAFAFAQERERGSGANAAGFFRCRFAAASVPELLHSLRPSVFASEPLPASASVSGQAV